MSGRADTERAVARAYADADGALSNEALYESVCEQLMLAPEEFNRVEAVGRAGAAVPVRKREVRWVQQSLKIAGLLERVEAGSWTLTEEGRLKLRRPARGMVLLGFSTDLGCGVWGDSRDVLRALQGGEDVTLVCTSPIYPIKRAQAYGGVGEAHYIDWLSGVLEPLIRRLRRGGNIALVLGNDVFASGRPARSMYRQRLVLALHERFGLELMDEIIWHNPSKAPGPVQWASKARQQLNTGYEVVQWFTNDAVECVADNRRVLQAHTERQLALIAQGGEQRSGTYSDDKHRVREGVSFSARTEGAIPRNVQRHSHTCGSQRAYKRRARELGLPAHGAPLPESLARFLVRFLSEEGDLCVDPFAGSFTVPLAAEKERRRWLGVELFGEYVRGGAERFSECSGFGISEALAEGICP